MVGSRQPPLGDRWFLVAVILLCGCSSDDAGVEPNRSPTRVQSPGPQTPTITTVEVFPKPGGRLPATVRHRLDRALAQAVAAGGSTLCVTAAVVADGGA
jgi:hypothetical protein